MTEFDNTNRGSIWGNTKKETEKHPDYTGSLNVNGVEFWVSGWKRKPDANPKAPALSISIKEKEQSAPQTAPQTAPVDNSFDDIPF